MRRFLCCAGLMFALVGEVRAADPATAETVPWYAGSLSVVTGQVRAVGAAAGSVWASISSLFGGSPPYSYLPSQISEDDRQFIATLETLGLTLGEINVGGGIFSHSSYRFVASREPSDVDIQRAEGRLQQYGAGSSGLRATAEQHIVRAILDVASDKDFVLGAAVVELWPWPSAHYEISARNRPPEVADRRMFDAAQR